ncbi:MAG: FkbM family methyltransferase [Pseudomonadales bacterium]|nr:FkbM family methyltransferase [Pseudomonadales bacterium]
MSRPVLTTTTSLQHRITVFANDHIGDKIRRRGLYEKENLEFLNRILARMDKPVVLDIGANIGNHSLAFATQAAFVHAFEPLPEVFALLSRNIAQNRLSHVHAHNVALSDSTGDATMYMVRHGNVGASSFDRRHEDVEAVRVHKCIGDDYLKELKLGRLDLIKIDVEAHEAYVLGGLRQTLQAFLPYLTLEWNDPLTLERLGQSEILTFLQAHYRFYVLGSNYDAGHWQGRPLAFLRRKFTRLFLPRRAVLLAFDPSRIYKNLLLVPHGKESFLESVF